MGERRQRAIATARHINENWEWYVEYFKGDLILLACAVLRADERRGL